MPRKARFSARDVVDAAVELVREKGLAGFSAPAVAAKMGSSTMPIYSHFKNMQALEDAVVLRAWELVMQYEARRYTGDAWIDQAIGYIRFAREERHLLKCTLDGRNKALKHEMHARQWQHLTELLRDYEGFAGLDTRQVAGIRYARAMLSHGVAMSPNVGINRELAESESLLASFLKRASRALLAGAGGLSPMEDTVEAAAADRGDAGRRAESARTGKWE